MQGDTFSVYYMRELKWDKNFLIYGFLLKNLGSCNKVTGNAAPPLVVTKIQVSFLES